jgi:hypothetical protein
MPRSRNAPRSSGRSATPFIGSRGDQLRDERTGVHQTGYVQVDLVLPLLNRQLVERCGKNDSGVVEELILSARAEVLPVTFGR